MGFVELSFLSPRPLSDKDKCSWYGKGGLGILFVSLREARNPNISLPLCLEIFKKFLLMLGNGGRGGKSQKYFWQPEDWAYNFLQKRRSQT